MLRSTPTTLRNARFKFPARDKQLPTGVCEELLLQATEQGVDVQKLIWVGQTRDDG